MNRSVAQPGDTAGRCHFLLRRLHSLSGVVPMGLFVIFHLFTNAQLARSAAHFQHEVNFIHLLPALLVIEVLLWLAIAFHAVLGLYYTFAGARPNVLAYPYWGNWRYLLQRITGVLAMGFIFFHIATLRWRWNLGLETPFFLKGVTPDGRVVGLAGVSTAVALQSSAWVAGLYFLGVFSVIYHWSNGLWTAAITWGLTLTVQAQRRWAWCCSLLFIALLLFSGAAFYGALSLKPTEHNRAQWQAYRYMVERCKAGRPVDLHDASIGQVLPVLSADRPSAGDGR